MLFTFPSRYWFTIGLTGVFSLTGWSRRIRAGFHVSRVTQDTAMLQSVSNKGLSPAMALLSRSFFSHHACNVAVLLPRNCVATAAVWASSPFARRYSGNRFYFLFLLLLRCFSSQACRFHACPPGMQVCPFGNPGINDYVHLLPAYRSLSRPSSPL